MSQCRSCGASIFWAVSVNGARMPVDAVPSPAGNVLVSMSARDPRDKRAVVLGHDAERPRDRNLYTSHHATCPDAKKHRTTREKRT